MQLKNYFLRYFPNQYKTQQRCDEAILENAETLKYVPTATKIRYKAVENYPHALGFVPECYKTQKTV